jgi:hypothetical protein
MKKVAVIGMTGKKRAGKDESFRAIQAKLPSSVRIAFADPLKQELAQACGVTLEQIEQTKEAFRPGLQWWATEFRRGLCGESYWVDRAREQFFKSVEHCNPAVVCFTDVRFPDEIRLIRELGGKVWRVYRPVWGPAPADEHPSETALDHIAVDRSIWNDRDIPALHSQVLDALQKDFEL